MSTMVSGSADLSTPLPQERFLKIRKDSEGLHITELYHVKPDFDMTTLPAVGTAHSTYGVGFQYGELDQKSPQTADLTLFWELDGGGSGTYRREKEIRLGQEMVYLKDVYAFNPSLLDPSELTEYNANNQTKRTKPMSVILYTFSTPLGSFTWSEENLLAVGINAYSEPTGVSGATSGKWFSNGPTIRRQGGTTIKSQTWTYRNWKP